MFRVGFSLVSFTVCAQVLLVTSKEVEKRFIAIKGMALQGHVISTHHVTSPIDCSFLCTSNNKCKSYNYKPRGSGEEQDVCQLNNATRQTSPAAYKHVAGFVHYFDESETYKSCLDHLRNGARENGIYNITDTSGDSFPVFCDLTSEPRTAWTLILSMVFKNRNMPEFCSKLLSTSAPLNENTPNWEVYRLSLGRMQRLFQQSTHIRLTTGFVEYGIDFRDYLRAKSSSVNIFNLINPYACKQVEYVSVRGHNSHDVTVYFVQRPGYIFHSDSSTSICQFDATSGSVTGENNFGLYCTFKNVKFRGSMYANSTTEYWFGGSLP